MKKSKFSEEQIGDGLRPINADTPVANVCCHIGSSEATLYVWRKQFAHLGVVEVRRMRQLDYARPGKPTDNRLVESSKSKLRNECVYFTQSADIPHAQQVIAPWRTDHNEAWPHGALGQLTPKEFAEPRQEPHPKEAA